MQAPNLITSQYIWPSLNPYPNPSPPPSLDLLPIDHPLRYLTYLSADWRKNAIISNSLPLLPPPPYKCPLIDLIKEIIKSINRDVDKSTTTTTEAATETTTTTPTVAPQKR